MAGMPIRLAGAVSRNIAVVAMLLPEQFLDFATGSHQTKGERRCI